MRCHQCDRPAFWSYGDDSPALCLHCAEKLQHILNAQFLQNAAMLNQALDDMDAAIPIGPVGGRVPIGDLAKAMQKGSVLNNITVTNSNIGVLNTGDLTQIDSYISMTANSDAAEVGEHLRALVQAVLDSTELNSEAKGETVELLKALSQQLAGDRKKSVMMSLLKAVEDRAQGAAAIVQLASTLGLYIGKLFGG
jgi:hypothetical protein